MTADPGPILARGRMADVFAVGRGLVLRRYRDPTMDAAPEAAAMDHLYRAGFPVPRVEAVDGRDLVLQRLDGPTLLAELTRRPWRLSAGALLLADLHTRLSRVEAPAELPTRVGDGAAMLHLDLHPGNVVLTRDGPVVIDWTGASRGPAGADVANTWLLLGCVRPDGGRMGRALAGSAAGLVSHRFVEAAGAAAAREHLGAVYAYRRRDPNMSAAELRRMRRLVGQETGTEPPGSG